MCFIDCKIPKTAGLADLAGLAGSEGVLSTPKGRRFGRLWIDFSFSVGKFCT